MAYDDLRSFLDTLDTHRQLRHVGERVMPEPDLGAAANAAARLGDTAPALYFDNVAGFTTPGSRRTCTARGPTTRWPWTCRRPPR
ncbi:hypothetical protein [Gandjariella thermophila]|uniref:3-octaprenyl-4-hydroxybenzoate carboxy-lyase-like N-terminal domain-containing protein n=1 Tax=Gandjariella thermophila TaxID=1931992 RepID=A0A4D4IWW6_9PSEU|nr:hypothetical protein [Gandjariella thermophila]GDY28835.1 hypothetical protein GTS_04680 [Gandjariella thermophila]